MSGESSNPPPSNSKTDAPDRTADLSDRTEDSSDSPIDIVLTADTIQFDRIVTLFFLVVLGGILVLTPQYPFAAQTFPLLIGIPTFLLLLAILAIQFGMIGSPELLSTQDTISSERVSDFEAIPSNPTNTSDPGKQVYRRKRLCIALVWLILLFASVYLFGILVGSFLFLLSFYRYEAEQNWPRTIAYTLGMWLFLVIVFQVFLHANLYTGFFEVQLPLPF